jgi:hypothetical protein
MGKQIGATTGVLADNNMHKHRKMRQSKVHQDGDNAVAQKEEQNAYRKMISLNSS